VQPSGVVSTIAFWFVFGLAIILAVWALGINALTDFIDGIVSYPPNVIAAVLVLLVAIAIGFALAFGLGGHEVSREMLAGAYCSGKQRAPELHLVPSSRHAHGRARRLGPSHPSAV
jgi:hypothetical protein